MDFGFDGGWQLPTLPKYHYHNLYHEHFLHGTSTFNGNSVPCTMKPTFIFTPKQSQNEEEKKNF